MKDIIFDFDGVLVDSMPTFGQSVLEVFRQLALPCPENMVELATPLGYGGSAEFIRTNYGVTESKADLVARMIDFARDAYVNRIPAKEGVKETLQTLRQAGCCLNILTASPHDTVDPCLKRLGIYAFFTNIWSCEDFGTTKADPSLYHLVAAKLGTTVDQCTFLDDNIHSLSTGRKAGMQVIGVYDASSANATEQMQQVSGRYIYSFSELPALIL